LPTCSGLVSDTANKSVTSRCNGIWETTRHSRHNGLLPAPTCYGLLIYVADLLWICCGETGVTYFGLQSIKPCSHCRRKVRLSPKTARQRRQLPNSATVALFCDSRRFCDSRNFLRQIVAEIGNSVDRVLFCKLQLWLLVTWDTERCSGPSSVVAVWFTGVVRKSIVTAIIQYVAVINK